MALDKVVVVTGGAHGIGLGLVTAFQKLGAKVCVFDIESNPYFVGDLAKPEHIDNFVKKVIADYGRVDILINNAAPLFKGIDDCSYEEFMNAQAVGVGAPFYLAKLLKPYFNPGSSIINLSSTRDRMSQSQSESYSAAKGGIAALTHSLAVSMGPNVRVNSISPGWIDTENSKWTTADHSQHPVGRIGKVSDIVELVCFLSSDKASFITGENITVDGGMSKLMIYHGDHGWSFDESHE